MTSSGPNVLRENARGEGASSERPRAASKNAMMLLLDIVCFREFKSHESLVHRVICLNSNEKQVGSGTFQVLQRRRGKEEADVAEERTEGIRVFPAPTCT